MPLKTILEDHSDDRVVKKIIQRLNRKYKDYDMPIKIRSSTPIDQLLEVVLVDDHVDMLYSLITLIEKYKIPVNHLDLQFMTNNHLAIMLLHRHKLI